MTDRIKNGFQFEWDDREIGYGGLIGDFGIEKSIPVGSRKFIVFNYSTEYFRRKVADKSALVFLRGGNIPSSGMSSSITLEAVSDSQDAESSPRYITCSTLTGTANEIVQAATPADLYDNIAGNHDRVVVNLSPNRLLEVPTECDQPWPKDKEIIYEKGKDQKPNMLYFLAYQPSCSENLFAAGFAHEDPYTCLKKSIGDGAFSPDIDFQGVNYFSTCCDYFCNVNFRGFFINKDDEYVPILPSGCFVQLQSNGLGGTFYNGISVSLVDSFCCKELNTTAGNITVDETICPNSCSFGFGVSLSKTGGYLDKLCPEKEGDNGSVLQPSFGTVVVTYIADGNKDCGCSGRGGTVSLTGKQVCTICNYQDFFKGGETIVEKKCKSTAQSSSIICTRLFNHKENVAGVDLYFTTMVYPTFKFPDGQGVEIGDDGVLRSKPCQPLPRNCNDVN